MFSEKKLIVSHAPFWHDGSSITQRNVHAIIAALPAVLFGFTQYGGRAFGLVCLSISFSMFWEWGLNRIMRRPVSIGDGNAALLGLVLAMMLPATFPWWALFVGTLTVILLGKHVFGGIGGNPFNPVLVGIAILELSWKGLFNFNAALVHFDLPYQMAYPLASLKAFGPASVEGFSFGQLLLGMQSGGVGATFGLGLIAGGIYLMGKGIARWEISLSFLAGVFITALIFYAADSTRFAPPLFHLLTGYTLLGAFFLAPEDSSSPVNFIPMLIYGAGAGVLTVLIRNIGAYIDGVVLAVLVMNCVNPLLDKIRPKALGKAVQDA